MRRGPGIRGLGAAALAALALGGCSTAGAPAAPAYPADADALTVSAAENFYGDLLHQLGGARLRVYSFISDPTADPHEYESNAGAARAVADSRLVIENGLGYDSFVDRLLGASPRADRTVINVQRLVGAADGANPHLWYDPTVMPRVARAAADALERLDAADAAAFRTNLAAYLASLGPITGRVASLRARFAGTPVAFTEAVYGYTAAAIGLDVRSPAAFTRAVEEGNDPSPAAIAEEQDLLKRRQVHALIYNRQTETRVTSALRDLARESGVPVLGVTETQPRGVTFQAWQLDQLQGLEAALAGAP